ncbi:MAG: glycoside hydrolase family 2 TIM barrel-domain containing protein [Alistipes dispar]
MKRILFLCTAMALSGVAACHAASPRSVVTLNEGWEFSRGEATADSQWQMVRIPHDWAIYGPFSRDNDLQEVAVEQNGEQVATVKTGRTGGLPFLGKGCYRRTISIPDTTDRSHVLLFDGAMSNARVRVNGREVAYWPYGYNSFVVDITPVAVPGENRIEVSLENFEKASRWYPGAGLYRNVHLISTNKVHIPVWGTRITTPTVLDDYASVALEIEVEGLAKHQGVDLVSDLLDAAGNTVASARNRYVYRGQRFTQHFLVNEPQLWSPESPTLYTARTRIERDGEVLDEYETRFGIRTLEYVPEKGFFLNGRPTKFKGVCNHHDLGPLGAAVNRSAIRYQIELLKEMGANAIRTAHNMPAPELVELCDEMGMMLMVEPFDDWGFRPKSPNGYGRFFAEWAERDMTNMIRAYRNSPSVVMWSIGNEVPSQWGPDGMDELVMLRDLVHHLDPTRPVTCGMDQIGAVLDNGFAAALDIPGFNYKPQYYDEAYERLPQRLILGSETASTVSSRGVYHFPVTFAEHNVVLHPDHQSSSYDNESCSWSNTPDLDFARDDDHEWVLGQFVWTGFDYLGEPSPYDTDAWPSHSSLFGIIDLAWLPKDRYWLYRSQWNDRVQTLHVLPHWTWPGREGETTPVFVYTSYPKAELFVNGESQGVREKTSSGDPVQRYRLMWNDVKYQPGEIRVVAYDTENRPVEERVVRTAGKAYRLVVTPNRQRLAATGDDLLYVTVEVEDRNGNRVPADTRTVSFRVEGAGTFEATANGDPTCTMSFQEPRMKLFSGAATAIVRSSRTPGTVRLTVSAPGVKSASLEIPVIPE